MFFERWELSERPAVITPSAQYSYDELNHAAEWMKKQFSAERKQLIVLLCEPSYEVLVSYIAALRSRHAVMLLSGDLAKELLSNVIEQYAPQFIVGSREFEGYAEVASSVWKAQAECGYEVHDELAVLLSTSGTTGSQKFVRLSYENIQSNAESIAEYLQLDATERGLLNLPLSYSYGMSIVNSHLEAGAAVLLTADSVLEKSFWSFVSEQQATSFAGVPFTYQMLARAGFLKMELPHLRMFTQAGGRLDARLVKLFGEYAKEHRKRFYIMYGQTEASPRISYIPPEQLLAKTETIGIAVPGGCLRIAEETGELVYEGSNVMMGYAENAVHLAKGDEMGGVLYTGDLAVEDSDGYFTITGRAKRFVKLFGLRVNLDEIERKIEQQFEIAAACAGTDDRMVVVIEDEQLADEVKQFITQLYKLHRSAFKIVSYEIPRLTNGKTDYRSIKDV